MDSKIRVILDDGSVVYWWLPDSLASSQPWYADTRQR